MKALLVFSLSMWMMAAQAHAVDSTDAPSAPADTAAASADQTDPAKTDTPKGAPTVGTPVASPAAKTDTKPKTTLRSDRSARAGQTPAAGTAGTTPSAAKPKQGAPKAGKRVTAAPPNDPKGITRDNDRDHKKAANSPPKAPPAPPKPAPAATAQSTGQPPRVYNDIRNDVHPKDKATLKFIKTYLAVKGHHIDDVGFRAKLEIRVAQFQPPVGNTPPPPPPDDGPDSPLDVGLTPAAQAEPAEPAAETEAGDTSVRQALPPVQLIAKKRVTKCNCGLRNTDRTDGLDDLTDDLDAPVRGRRNAHNDDLDKDDSRPVRSHRRSRDSDDGWDDDLPSRRLGGGRGTTNPFLSPSFTNQLNGNNPAGLPLAYPAPGGARQGLGNQGLFAPGVAGLGFGQRPVFNPAAFNAGGLGGGLAGFGGGFGGNSIGGGVPNIMPFMAQAPQNQFSLLGGNRMAAPIVAPFQYGNTNNGLVYNPSFANSGAGFAGNYSTYTAGAQVNSTIYNGNVNRGPTPLVLPYKTY